MSSGDTSPDNGLPEFVFCVGMRRGGSTLQTQLVKDICGVDQVRLVTPDTIDIFLAEERPAGQVTVVKTHLYSPQIAQLAADGRARIVYVYRDLRDVIASIVRKYDSPPFSFVYGGLKKLIREYDDWMAVPEIHVARYESMIEDIGAEALAIAGYLKVPLSAEQAGELADRHSAASQKQKTTDSDNSAGAGDNRFDSRTLLHSNHIQSGGSGAFTEILPRRVIAALEWQGAEWFREHGYEPTCSKSEQWAAASGFRIRGLLHRLRKALFLRRTESGSSSA